MVGLSVDSIEVRASVGSRLSARIARFVQSRDRSSPMTKPISPLRQRMIDDMIMRNLSANTQETYIRSVAQFSALHSPKVLGVEHQQMVRALAPDGADQAFNISVLPRGTE
jgi:hypothetical protein